MSTLHAATSVPHLTTALTGPLRLVESRILENQSRIEAWFREQWRSVNIPFYASVDIRNAGYKIAPVDTNLFPAGFNNLNPVFESLCIQAVQQAVERLAERVDRILIIPENHTRNMYYLESLWSLQRMIEKAGFHVRIGSLIPDLEEKLTIDLPSGQSIVLEPVQKRDAHLVIDDFEAELVLLNNDLSGGIPDELKGLDQILMPPLRMGWSSRLKSTHFKHYQEVAGDFANMIDIDPWLIDPMFRNCGEIDFMKQEGSSCLTKNVETLLNRIRDKFSEYEVNCQPYVMMKADSGTYGMGVMTIHSAGEVTELNRKERTRMSTTKEGQKVTKVIIQEGVYTHESWGSENSVAEPVVYMVDNKVVGGFYRVHTQRGRNENLNSPGMRFEPLAFDECCISPDASMDPDAHPNRFYTYGVVARLALLAAAREMMEGQQ
ncbi:MAG: glutamate--cysteine ligase [Gammaproteobacteria bacterium]|nr:glutamate--cysteine ligase [Gammaproteobacteria bacterium]